MSLPPLKSGRSDYLNILQTGAPNRDLQNCHSWLGLPAVALVARNEVARTNTTNFFIIGLLK